MEFIHVSKPWVKGNGWSKVCQYFDIIFLIHLFCQEKYIGLFCSQKYMEYLFVSQEACFIYHSVCFSMHSAIAASSFL